MKWLKYPKRWMGSREELGVSPLVLFVVMLFSFWLTYMGLMSNQVQPPVNSGHETVTIPANDNFG